MPLTRDQPYWGYEDIGLFFFFTFFLGLLLHAAVRIHLLDRFALSQPILALQVFAPLFQLIVLYAILKIRYQRPVCPALGWTPIPLEWAVRAVLGGAIIGLPVILYIRWTNWPLPAIGFWEFILLGALLGPLLEESFFRGFLLPVVARTKGVFVAIFLCALLFTVFHRPSGVAQWISFTTTGVAYGWIWLKSGSTMAAIIMHASYNLTLFLYQITE